MPLDGAALRRGCQGAQISEHRHLCRSQVERFRAMLGQSEAITVACTQEAPLFEEVAADLDYSGDLTFANIREAAGWSSEANAAGPKMAALLAAASEPMPPASFTTLASKGVALIYGRDEVAIGLAQRLAEHLDVTVLLSRPGEIAPRSRRRAAGSAPSSSPSTTMPPPARPRAASSSSKQPATARSRIATSSSTSPAARRSSRPAICARAICAPTRATGRRSSGSPSRRAGWSASSTSRPMSSSTKGSAPIRARRRPAAPAASSSARPARSRRPAIMSRSRPRSAPAAAPALPSARPAR